MSTVTTSLAVALKTATITPVIIDTGAISGDMRLLVLHEEESTNDGIYAGTVQHADQDVSALYATIQTLTAAALDDFLLSRSQTKRFLRLNIQISGVAPKMICGGLLISEPFPAGHSL